MENFSSQTSREFRLLSRLTLLALLMGFGLAALSLNRHTRSASTSQASASAEWSEPLPGSNLADRYGQLPLGFEKNEGQSDSRVKFLARGQGYEMFLTNAGVVLTVSKAQAQRVRTANLTFTESAARTSASDSTIRWTILGANRAASVSGHDELPGKVNYFIGNESAKWRSNIPTFARVQYENLYPGVDVTYYGNQGQLEYDFLIGRGVSPRKIRLSFAGMNSIRVDAVGDLILSTNAGDVKLCRPRAYQTIDRKRREVTASYILNGHHVSFAVGEYNQNEPLLIDPVLIYSSYLGGATTEQGLGVAVDSQGSAYLAGSTTSTDFPVVGSLQSTKGTAEDAFIVKLNPAGTAMIYATYLGGNGSDVANAIAVDSQGSAYVTGLTGSGSFPTTGGAFQSSSGGVIDSFVTKLSPSGSSLVYSTFLGGENNETGFGIAVDASGRAYVVGRTDSTRMGFFPLQRNGSPLYKSSDGVGQWAASAAGLTASGIPGLTIDPSNSDTLYAASTSGVFKSTDGGTQWSLTGGVRTSTAPTIANTVAVDPTNSAIVYVGGFIGGMYKSVNGGALYDLKNSGLLSTSINSVAIDPTTPTTLYAGSTTTIYKSVNGADTWTEIKTGLGTSSIRVNEIVIDPTNAAIVYVGTSRGMFKSTNGGGLWSPINGGALSNPFTPEITALVIDPTNPSILYASGRSSSEIIFKSTDAGASWTGSSTGLSYTAIGQSIVPTVNTLAIDRITPTTLYAATTGGGVFKSTNGGANWNQSNTGMPNSIATSVVVDRNNSAKVYVGTSIGSDAFATRLNAAGTAPEYLMSFGGVETDEARGVAIDGNGNAYVVGNTSSTDFPVMNALQGSYGGFQDAFVTKIDASGSGFIYSTYLGGNSGDQGRGIAVLNGNAYVVGGTNSSNFPLVNPFKNSLDTFDTDAFVTRLNASGTAADYSTYLGGEGLDQAFGVAVDSGGSAYITGSTSSNAFPTLSPIQSSLGGATDGFITKLTSAGNALVYSTYLGGLSGDQGNGIALDNAGNAYVIGNTSSNDFPTVKPFQPALKSSDAFVAKIGIEADLSITKKDSRDPVLVNTPFTYTLTVNNGGPSPATGVTVTDNLPAGMTFNSATPSQGSCSFANSQVTCAIGELANASGAVIAISVTPTTTGNFTNTATVEAAEPDSNNSNNTASENTKVSTSPSISGRVKDASNTGLSGILITLSGSQTATTQTDSTGFYQFAELPAGGSYTVTPGSSIFSFDPDSQSFNPLNNDQTADFLATACTYSLSSPSQSFISAGGSGNVSVTTLHGCPWTASSSDSWLTITSAATGVGSGIVNFSVSPTTVPRAAHLSVAGKNFAVYQEFNSCDSPAFSVATYNLDGFPNLLKTADLNGDGRLDVALATNAVSGGGIRAGVMLNDGSGGFSSSSFDTGLGTPQAFVVADFNSDNRPDLALTSYNFSSVRVFFNNGSGGFSQAGSTDIPFTTGGQSPLTQGLFTGDLNRDGRPDLVVSTPGTSGVQILLGNGAGGFTQAPAVNGSSLDVPLALMDVTGDNIPDLIYGGGGNNSRAISVRLGNGSGGFGSLITSAGLSVTNSAGAADFDGDGKRDLAATAVINIGTASNPNFVSTILIMLGDGAGHFVLKSNFNTPVTNLVPVDFNNDGKVDLAFTRNNTTVSIVLGDGNGGFGASIPVETGFVNSANFGIDGADFNGDGAMDIAVANSSRGASILRNSCAASPSISGRITDSRTTGGLAGATVNLSGAQTVTTQTDGGGNFIFRNLSVGANYVVTPTKDNFKFSPASLGVNNLTGIQTADFVGTPTWLEFTTQDYVVDENAGSIQISVRRKGDLSGVTTVDYATGAGTASSRTDYTAALGTLRFNAGESLKTFTVLVTDDNLVEGWESLSLVLSNPVGGIFNNSSVEGPPNTSLLEIRDNDVTTPSNNPIDNARFFVRQHYHDFLSREPDTSGWDFWTNQITSCGSDVQCAEVRRIDVSASFFLSIEFQQSGYLVERFYKVAYGDAAGTSNFSSTHQLMVPVVRLNEFLKDTQRIGQGVIVLQPGWEQLLENNKQAYASEFVVTTRFITAFPTTMTPAQFVDKLDQNAGNVLSPSERTAAINLFSGAVDSGNTTARAQAVRQVAEDTDLYNAEYNRAFVLAQYFGYLRRNPNDPQDSDYTGYDFWLTKLNQFNGNYINAEMVKAFLSSIEYRQRFGP